MALNTTPYTLHPNGSELVDLTDTDTGIIYLGKAGAAILKDENYSCGSTLNPKP